MIGWLRGEVISRDVTGQIIMNVNDVGFVVGVTMRHLVTLGVGEIVDLHVHTHVRDDAIVLYGFESPLERSTFELLLATPGVGPSTAMGALSKMTPAQLAEAISDEDVTLLATIPGIGRKTAARLILELGGKLPTLDTPGESAVRSDVTGDLVAALRQFGYSASEVRDALRDVELPDDDEGALRVALRQLGRV